MAKKGKSLTLSNTNLSRSPMASKFCKMTSNVMLACMTTVFVGSIWRFMKNAGFRRFWARKGLLGRGRVEQG